MPPCKPMVPPAPLGKRLSPAEYCWAAKDRILATRAEVRDAAGWRVYSEKGRDVAAMTVLGSELVVEFEPSRDLTELAKVKQFYTASRERSGWLRYTRPLTREPGPDLDAGLGRMLGAASWDRNKPPAVRRLKSAGGPYICLPISAVPSWGGFIEEGGRAEFRAEYKLYQRVMKCPDEGALVELGNGKHAIVLGTPDALYWKPLDGGGVLARVCSFDADDDAKLEKLLEKLPSSGWAPIGSLDVTEAYRAFDAAEFGGAIGDGNSLSLDLGAARFALSSLEFEPDSGTRLLLLRLTRTPHVKKKPTPTAKAKDPVKVRKRHGGPGR